MVWIAGVGSRDTPAPYLTVIHRLAGTLARRGVGIRSGHARGADLAWEAGALGAGGAVRLYLPKPRRGVDGLTPDELSPELLEAAQATARRHHGGWDRFDDITRRLMTRNVLIVLGDQLQTPVAGLACWAPRSRLRSGRVVDVKGGTGLAVRLAAERGIPVLNLALESHLDLARTWHRTEGEPLEALFGSLGHAQAA